MQKLLFLFIFLLSVPCAAQRHMLKEAAAGRSLQQMTKSAVSETIARHPRVVQGKILLERQKAKSEIPVDLEPYIFKKVLATDYENLPILLYEPSLQQELNAAAQYMEAMSAFEEFKRDMDIFLYYQSKPNERHELTVLERQDWNERINEVNAKLRRLKNIIAAHDPAYAAARKYMILAAEFINPVLRGLLTKQEFARTDRQYVQEEFYLHAPVVKNQKSGWMTWPPSFLPHRKPALGAPSALKIAVLNDRQSVLDAFEQAHQKVFFPDWKLSTYDNTEDLLRAVAGGQSFDLILTDIIVPGGGGYYLTASLRDKGFKGAILALSAYEEDEQMGLDLFKRGFDGMISVPTGFERNKKWPREIMEKLRHYFYYRDTNRWIR